MSENNHPGPAGERGPDAIRGKFSVVAAATDTPPPGDGRIVPQVDKTQPISALARNVGMILHAAPLFRMGNALVTVEPETGDTEIMTAERFCSWAEDFMTFTRPAHDSPAVVSIGKDLAAKIMAADQFKTHLRELNGIASVRLPVWRGEGEARTIDLAPLGYDKETGIFTVETVPYDTDMDAGDALRFFFNILRLFPFDPEGETNFARTRSFAAHMGVMVGTFCRLLCRAGVARPLIVYNANQPGSGKSLLMRMALCPVYGVTSESGKPENEAELEKILDAASIARKSYLVLDDVYSLRSQALNRFITSPAHEARLMHTQRLASAPKITQVFITGNGLTITADLDRRAVIVDLHEPGEASARTFQNPITPEWLALPATRADFLAALWALVKLWRDAGCPINAECRKSSFESWTETVGSIVRHLGLSNPFAQRQAEMGGDESTRALKRVLAIVAGEYPDGAQPAPTTQAFLDVAEREGLLEVITLTKNPKQSLGHKLRKLIGRHFTDTQGRVFEFGKRNMASGASYPITYLSAAPDSPRAPGTVQDGESPF